MGKKNAGGLGGLLTKFSAHCEAAVAAEAKKQAAVVAQLENDVKDFPNVVKRWRRDHKKGKPRNWQGATLAQVEEMLEAARGRETRTRETLRALNESLRTFIKSKKVGNAKRLAELAPAWLPEANGLVAQVKSRRARIYASQAVHLIEAGE